MRKTALKLVPRIYTSYYAGDRQVKELRTVNARAPSSFREGLTSIYGKPISQSIPEQDAEVPREQPTWEDAAPEGNIAVVDEQATGGLSTEKALPRRPYVPLSDVASIELQGDYLIEAGMAEDALRYYGVATAAYEAREGAGATPHTNFLKILVKLGRAFRLTGRHDAAVASLTRVLDLSEEAAFVDLETVSEALMELGRTQAARKDGGVAAAAAFEDVAALIVKYHNIGDSHRFLKKINKLCRSFTLNQHQKFEYYSPFDYDRCFAIADQALEEAERVYRANGNSAADVVRVLELRANLQDSKFFNMNENAGRMKRMRGHPRRVNRIVANGPTIEEILKFSPTIHQVHRDWSMEVNTPQGKEAMPGVNRRVVDDGSPRRREKVRRMRSPQEVLATRRVSKQDISDM